MRVGIVGLGRWGQRLVTAVQDEGRPRGDLIQVVAGHTRSPDKARTFIREHGIRLFDSYHELISSGDIDAVLIASPHGQHADQAMAAAAAGLHVYVEKPLALDLVSATRVVSLCQERDRLLAVGFNRRFLPAYQRLQELVKSGALGRILHVQGNFSGSFGMTYTPDVWHADRAQTPAGGMTLMGVHTLDCLIGLAGNVTGLRARSRRQHLEIDMDDTTDVTLEFEGGQTGYLSTLTATASHWGLQVFGTKGWAQMTDQDSLTVSMLRGPSDTLRFCGGDPERAELETFARSVLDRTRTYPVPLTDVLNGIAALDAIRTSIASGHSADPIPVSPR